METEKPAHSCDVSHYIDALIPRISVTLEQQTVFDPAARVTPLRELRYRMAVHASAACAIILDTSGHAFFERMAEAFGTFGASSDLRFTSGDTIGADCQTVLAERAKLHRKARKKALAIYDRGPAKAGIRALNQLVALGELSLVEDALRDRAVETDSALFAVSQRVMRAKGQHREAEICAAQLFAKDPAIVIESGESPRFLRSLSGHEPDTALLCDPSVMSINAALFHFDDLRAHDRLNDAILLAARVIGGGPVPPEFAQRLMRVFVMLDLTTDQKSALAPIWKRAVIPLRWRDLDPKGWLPAAVRKASAQPTSPAIWTELCAHAVSLLAATQGRPNTGDPMAKLWEIAFPQQQDAIRDALEHTGYRAATPYSGLHQFSVETSDFLSPQAIDTAQTDRAKQFLEHAKNHPNGTILFTLHASDMSGRDRLPSIAAADCGIKAMTFAGGASKLGKPSSQPDDQQNTFQTIERLSMQSADVTTTILGNLRRGGLLEIAVDVVVPAPTTVMIPWFLRPVSVPSFPAAMAVSLKCRIGVSITWVNSDGQLVHDILPAELPEENGRIAARAAWLTQKLGRACRRFAKENAVTLAPNLLVNRGGVPSSRELVALNEWRAEPQVATSALAWLGDAERGTAQIALRIGANTLSFAALQSLSLRMASLLMHYQTETPDHAGSVRDFETQHRIMLILPQGAAFLATVLAGLSVGSMVAVSQDDVPISQLVDRFTAFRPDLVIATASVWSSLLEAAPETASQPALIVADRGDTAAMEELVESFAPADHLPPVNGSDPGLVVFTSGSTGAPKGVVHPANATPFDPNGHCIGAGSLFGLTANDQLTYLARWDSVCMLDLLSALRASATICVPDVATMLAPAKMGKWLSDTKVTCLSAPVTIFRLMLQSGAMSGEKQPALRLTLPWGERLSAEVVGLLHRKFPNTDHIACYGASEALWVSYGPIPAGTPATLASPGGTLIASVETVLVDTNGVPVRAGEIGHPLVRGQGVMLGYFDDLMAGKAPQGTVVLEDFARLTEAGGIELLGRSDSVIKIAGRRISLIEVETAAERVVGVGDAMAMLDPRSETAQILVAVTSDDPDQARMVADVTRSISEHCFPAARPARVEVMAAFPNLPSGKRDRKAIEARLLDRAAVSAIAEPAIAATALLGLSPLMREIGEWAQRRFQVSAQGFDPLAQIPSLDSLMVIELLLIAETVCGTILPFDALNQTTPMRWVDLVAEIEQASA